MPLFTVMFASATRRDESIGPVRLAGVAVGFAGVLLFVGSPSAILNSGAAGQLAVVGAAASYAAGALYARTLLRRVDAPNFTAVKLGLGAVLASAAVAVTGGGGELLALGGADVAALVVLGVVCTGLAFVLYFRIVADVGSVAASTVTYVIPVFGLLFGVALLDESIGGRTRRRHGADRWRRGDGDVRAAARGSRGPHTARAPYALACVTSRGACRRRGSATGGDDALEPLGPRQSPLEEHRRDRAMPPNCRASLPALRSSLRRDTVLSRTWCARNRPKS